MKAALLWLGLLLPVSVWAAPAAKPEEIIFKGVLVSDGKTSVALTDSEGNSRWVEVGRDFAGYRVADYEPATEMLSLVKEGVTKQILLHDAKVRAVAPPKPIDGTHAERLAFWEKIKNLEGEALIQALASNENPKKEAASTFGFLAARNKELADQLEAAKRKLAEFTAKADESERSKSEASLLAQDVANHSRASNAIAARLAQAAFVEKAAVRASSTRPDNSPPRP